MSVFDFSIALAPALALVIVAGVFWLGLTRMLADAKLASLLTSLPMLGFFSFGAIEQSLRADGGGAWPMVIAGGFAAACLGVLALVKWRRLCDTVNYGFNAISLLLVAAPLLQAGLWNYGTFAARDMLPDRSDFDSLPEVGKADAANPDIYYFVLDGYGRDDVLRSDYEFDNTDFLEGLRQRGFYVADEAVANYPVTLVSLTSTMNFTYLQDVVGEELSEFRDRRFLREMMQESRAVRLLREAGYSIASFSSEYSEAQIGSVDVALSEWWFPNQFVIGLAQMTPIPAILGMLNQPVLYDLHRYRTVYPFDRIDDAIELNGPKFVYSHLYFGHPPFVFGADGEKISLSWDYTWDDGSRLLSDDDDQREKYMEGYRSQVSYLNTRVLEAVDRIISTSDRPPIIVLHGDHGPGSRFSTESLENTDVRERYSIFYSALLPKEGAEDLYPSMSPLNGLRIIFNRYLGSDYPVLADESYYNPFQTPYQFTRVDSEQLTRKPAKTTPVTGTLAANEPSEAAHSAVR